MADEELRGASREHWSRAAAGWAQAGAERESGPSGLAADWMLDAVALSPGESVLELAGGGGELGARAAEAVGESGRAVISDFAEPMVELIRERAQSLGLDQLEARVVDAEAPTIERESFDVVLCRFGYMLMADPAGALRASFGLLRPGGRLALAVWGTAEGNPWFSLISESLMDVLGAPPPEPGTPGPFALADPERVRTLLVNAGFERVETDVLETARNYESAAAWWEDAQAGSGPVSSLLAQLTREQRGAVGERALAAAAAYVTPDETLSLPVSIVLAHARTPV